jgi:Asp-tRNA(Asn)/Glu-tRNA(Gln) amidotransferase A subunit family amidase
MNDERTLLRIAYAFEERTPWQRQIPPGPAA